MTENDGGPGRNAGRLRRFSLQLLTFVLLPLLALSIVAGLLGHWYLRVTNGYCGIDTDDQIAAVMEQFPSVQSVEGVYSDCTSGGPVWVTLNTTPEFPNELGRAENCVLLGRYRRGGVFYDCRYGNQTMQLSYSRDEGAVLSPPEGWLLWK